MTHGELICAVPCCADYSRIICMVRLYHSFHTECLIPPTVRQQSFIFPLELDLLIVYLEWLSSLPPFQSTYSLLPYSLGTNRQAKCIRFYLLPYTTYCLMTSAMIMRSYNQSAGSHLPKTSTTFTHVVDSFPTYTGAIRATPLTSRSILTSD